MNELHLEKYGVVKTQLEMKSLTTLKIGGIADYYVEPKDLDALIQLIDFLNTQNTVFKVIGNGSNTLIGDKAYHGVIIRLTKTLNKVIFEDEYVYAEAGASLIKLANDSVNLGLDGLEFATGIPGSVGGAAFMNAGAYQKCMYQVISQVLVLKNHQPVWLDVDEIKHDYRYSSFMEDPTLIILAVKIKLKKGDKEASKQLVKDRLERRSLAQPLDKPSCGSVFRNPYPYSSWQLIEGVGLRGYQVGGAQISLKHANFIINIGQAKAQDVLDLIHLVQEKVKDKYGVEMVPEVEFFNL
jgi:UDP-N-acetylmuramate dehydrogenase